MRCWLWTFSSVLFFSLVLAVPLKLRDQQPLSSHKNYWHQTISRGDSYYPSLDARIRRALLTQRRKLEFAWRGAWEYVWPKVNAEKLDVFLLRNQEDALFMTPQALFQSTLIAHALYQHPPSKVGPREERRVHPERLMIEKPHTQWIFQRRIKAEDSEL